MRHFRSGGFDPKEYFDNYLIHYFQIGNDGKSIHCYEEYQNLEKILWIMATAKGEKDRNCFLVEARHENASWHLFLNVTDIPLIDNPRYETVWCLCVNFEHCSEFYAICAGVFQKDKKLQSSI